MCVVLDANAFSALFDSSNKEHDKFRPVFEWIVNGKGKLVYGGDKYKGELRAARRYLRFFAILEKAGKIVKVPDDDVNNKQRLVQKLETNKKFNDPHLVAIILVSKCKIICTNDESAIPFLKDVKFYAKKSNTPKIYKSKVNISLLVDKFIVDICKPCNKLTKSKAKSLRFI